MALQFPTNPTGGQTYSYEDKTWLYNNSYSAWELDPKTVYLTGNQNISGVKSFYDRPLVNGTGVMLSGEAAPLPTTIVYQTGDQTISGQKYFIDSIGVGTTGIVEKITVSGSIKATETVFAKNLNLQVGAVAGGIGVNGAGTLLLNSSNINGANIYGDTTIIGNGKVGIGSIDSTSRFNIVDTTLAGSGSLSGSILNLAQTWNTSGTPKAIKLNVTDTASNAASLLMDLQVGGVSKFRVGKNGSATFESTVTCSTSFVAGQGIYDSSYNFELNNNGLKVRSSKFIGFTSGASYDTTDTLLYRDAAAILAQRNGTNAQTFRLYNTFTDASNYERGFLRWDTNVLKIGAEALGTGTNRNIEFVAGGSTRMTITSSGNIGIGISSPDANTLLTVNDSSTAQKNVSIDIRNGNYGWWRVTSSNTNNAGKLSFSSNNSGQTPLVLDGAGYVGIGAATPTAKLDILDTALAGSGSLAGSALNIAQTWNTTGTPTAIKLNITDTASNAASLLMDLQVGGSSKLSMSKGSLLKAGNSWSLEQTAGSLGIGGPSGGNGVVFYPQGGSSVNGYLNISSSNGAVVPSNRSFCWSSNTDVFSSPDTYLYRDATATLAQRNGTNAQTFRIYNTYTDASNYERGFLRWNTNVLEIGTEAAGTGSSRNLQLLTGGTARWIVDTSGRLVANGQYGVFSMWQGGFNVTSGGTSVIARFYGDSGHTRISSSETSLCLEIPRLTFNGTTSSFPAIKRSATTLQIRLADDSGDASLTAANITCSGHLAAATKSFKIPHQTKSGYLQYGVVESNEHSVYVRGKASEDTIILPDHWDWLVDENSVTVQVTPIGKPMSLWVIEQTNKVVKIGGVEGSYNYTIYGTRKDVPELEVELES